MVADNEIVAAAAKDPVIAARAVEPGLDGEGVAVLVVNGDRALVVAVAAVDVEIARAFASDESIAPLGAVEVGAVTVGDHIVVSRVAVELVLQRAAIDDVVARTAVDNAERMRVLDVVNEDEVGIGAAEELDRADMGAVEDIIAEAAVHERVVPALSIVEVAAFVDGHYSLLWHPPRPAGRRAKSEAVTES